MKRFLERLQLRTANFQSIKPGVPAFKTLLSALLTLALIAALLSSVPVGAQPALQAVNLALNKPVTCSPTPQYPCAQAVDGNTGTRWASAQGVDPQWIYVDLGATTTISSVTLRWEAAYATAFQIQTSPDAVTWTSIYSTTTGTGGVQTLTVSGSGRYVRMNGTARATIYGYSLWEFEIYGAGGATNTPTRTNTAVAATATRTNTPVGPTLTPTRTSTRTNTPVGPTPTATRTLTRTNTPVGPTLTATQTRTATATSTLAAGCGGANAALNKTTTASSVLGGNTAPMAVDGNTGTRWESTQGVDPQWIYVDLGSVQNICRVKLTWEPAYASSYQIQTSPDVAAWTTIYSTTTGDGGVDDLTGLSGSGRYVRMYGSARGTVWGYSLWEFEVYTGSSGPTNTPTRTNTPGAITATPTITATPGASTCTGSGPAGTFPLCLQNNTGGAWSNSQIYVTALGMPSAGQWHYLKPDGSTAHINHLDASAANHLTKNGVNYANMSFTLAQASTVTMPVHWEGARIYISINAPMYIPISPDDAGWGGPDLHNPADPNADSVFDWYEMTYVYGQIPFGGNTTQVDMFGFPMTARLQQTSSAYDQTVGITISRAQVFSQYSAYAGAAFDPLVTANGARILAPRSSATFDAGGSQANYLQAYIDQTWTYYTNNQFTLLRQGITFSGRVSGSVLTFTVNPAGGDGPGPFVLNKPTTKDVVQCSGALASAGMTTSELALGAEFCAAFNRGVALDTTQWWGSPANYYINASHNDYAGFFHTIGLQNRAYGFAYDDINDQSSVKILGNSNPPSSLTIGIGW